MKGYVRIGLGLLIATASLAQAQTVIFVDDDAPAGGNGITWLTAYDDLQDALAVAPDEIRVAEGTYKPGAQRTDTFQLIAGVAIHGGYRGLGSGGDPNDRDIAAFPTILSGDIGIPADPNDNSFHVVTGSGTDTTAVLDGFTVASGRADGVYPHNNGGGMYNWGNGSPTVTSCVFSGNSATNAGGGMRNSWSSHPALTNCTFAGNAAPSGAGMYNHQDSAPTVTNCIFIGNSSTEAGGGLLNDHGCSPTLTNCRFLGNSAPLGGGMYNWVASNPTLTHCTFIGNLATTEGGGMFNGESSCPTLMNCAFSGNSAEHAGGGIRNCDSSPLLVSCTFSGNSAANDGGAVDNITQSHAMLINCMFTGNSSTYGGGMRNDDSNSTLVNCTFTGNTARTWGGAIYNWNSSPSLANCIIWGNVPEEVYVGSGVPVVTYSCIRGGWEGEGNVDVAPLFAGDFRIAPGSPCIDAGSNGAVPADACDLDGDGNTAEPIPFDLHGLPRFYDDPATPDTGSGEPCVVDMGAYEYVLMAPAGSGDLDGDGDVDVDDFASFQQQFTGPLP